MQANTKEDFYNLVTRVEASFESKFKRQARWIAAAPGRVNLMGEHTDYNGGFVFPMAIERSTVLAADEREGRRAAMCKSQYTVKIYVIRKPLKFLIIRSKKLVIGPIISPEFLWAF